MNRRNFIAFAAALIVAPAIKPKKNLVEELPKGCGKSYTKCGNFSNRNTVWYSSIGSGASDYGPIGVLYLNG